MDEYEELERALIADGEKLQALTGEDNGPWALDDFRLSEEHHDELVSLAEGYEASDYAESLLLKALQPHIDAFHADDRSDFTMRQLRISNDARSNARNSRRAAAAIRAALHLLTVEAGQ